MSMTVGELRSHLAVFDDHDELSIAGGLTVYRVKSTGDNSAFLEFNEIEVPLSEKFKEKHPEVQVAFCSFDSDGSLVQEVSVPVL